jgi:hypothetical protein
VITGQETSSSTVVVTDLDRTLIYSPSALMLAGSNVTVQRLLCVEVYKGRPHSFVTEKAAAGLGALNEAGLLVPATTRTVEQFQRISLPGPAPTFALCANGGRLLRNGVEDLDFTAEVAQRLEAVGAPAAEVLEHLHLVSGAARSKDRFVDKVRDAAGLFCYAVVDLERMPGGWVEDLTGFATDRGWGVSVQGRKVYVVPTALSKATAARVVADMMGFKRIASAGDSFLDGEMLDEADVAIRPGHGELADAGWVREHVTVTRTRGVLAGEEIVDWMLTQTKIAL